MLKLQFYTQSCGLGLDLDGPGLGQHGLEESRPCVRGSASLGLEGPGLVNITVKIMALKLNVDYVEITSRPTITC